MSNFIGQFNDESNNRPKSWSNCLNQAVLVLLGAKIKERGTDGKHRKS